MGSMPSVALLGTGLMGAGMARNLARAGVPIKAWNRTASKAEPLAKEGITVAGTPAEAVQGADVVITMLMDAAAVGDTMQEASDGLRAGAVWVQASTVGVEGCDELADLAKRLDLTFVDAPVLGTKGPADTGSLIVLASGPQDAQPTVQPLFDAIGQRTLWVGSAGAGSRLKLACNAFVITMLEGIAEGLALTKALGVEPAKFLEALAGGASDAPYVQLKGRAMLGGQYEAAFSLAGALKDARLITEAGRAAGLDMAVLAAVRDHLGRAVDAGHGDKDMAATYLEHTTS